MTNDNRAHHFAVGEKGEEQAVQFLQAEGYRILDRNVRSGRHGEIDIIALDPKDSVLAFIEVKTRSRSSDEYVPSLNLTTEKRLRMFRAARRWMTTHGYDGGYRFDLIGIAGDKITEHILDVRVRDEKRRPKRSWQVVPW